jgi:cystathionine beta-lyase/cystathionine gamma-synthase
MKAFGGIISLEVEGGEEGARKFAAQLKLFATAESLGGIESLINHPWTMTHAAIPEKQRYDAGMTPGLIRLSVGIEDVEDLWQDLVHALNFL